MRSQLCACKRWLVVYAIAVLATRVAKRADTAPAGGAGARRDHAFWCRTLLHRLDLTAACQLKSRKRARINSDAKQAALALVHSRYCACSVLSFEDWHATAR